MCTKQMMWLATVGLAVAMTTMPTWAEQAAPAATGAACPVGQQGEGPADDWAPPPPPGMMGGPGGPDAGEKGFPFGGGDRVKQMMKRFLKQLPTLTEMNDKQLAEYKGVAKAHYEKIAALMDQMKQEADGFRTKVDSILTAEQKAKLEAKRQEMEKHMRGRLGGGMMGGPGGMGPMGPGGPQGGPGMMGPGGPGRGEGQGPGQNPMRPKMLRKAIEGANLPAEAKAKALAVIDESQKKVADLPKGDREARMQLFGKTLDQLKATLTEEQMKSVTDNIRKLGREMRRGGQGGPDGGAGMMGPGGDRRSGGGGGMMGPGGSEGRGGQGHRFGRGAGGPGPQGDVDDADDKPATSQPSGAGKKVADDDGWGF